MIENNQVMTKEEAIQLANEIERTEAALSQMKEQLKAFAKINGPVATSEKVWDFMPSYSWDFDKDKLKDMAIAMAIEGYNPWDLFKLSSTSIKKLGWSDEVLKQYGEKKESQRTFRSVKVQNYQA